MRLTVVGCGDAFGSGGRLQTSYLIDSDATRFLIDCGASTLIGFNKLKIDPNSVPLIFISHLHGDHYSGLVWWLVHARHVAKRKVPLTVVGPKGIAARFKMACDALFPGAYEVDRPYELKFIEMTASEPLDVGGVRVTAFEVEHPSGAPSLALRFEVDGKVLGFTGDTQWTESLVPAGRNADFYIMECYQYEGSPRYHMAWKTIEANLARIAPKRVLLTHMADGMLARRSEVSDPRIAFAEDGLVVEI